jgi:hypothetical protein
MILKHSSDLTPGGTCTVGIRSLVTGAFLTSTVINQSALKQDEWNTFDFPNISVTNGGTYFLVVVCSDGDVMWLASGSAPYSGGQHYYSLNGSSWNTNAIYDHVFRVYGGSTTTVPLTKSTAWRVRMEVKDANGQVSQAVRDIWTNAYDTPPTVSLNSSQLTGTTSTTFNLSATGSDANSGTTWDGLLNYRWDVDGDGNFETEFAATSTRSASFAKAGTYQATVEVRDRYYATARASVTLTVAPASGATQMSIFAGNNQSASTGVAVPIAPAVLVRNASSNPVSGVVVVFSVLSGDGTITNATQTTNASGIATLGSWTLGSVAGPNSLGATMPHYPQPSPLTFNATAVAPPTVKRRGQLISD